jgi:hypothetical protein
MTVLEANQAYRKAMEILSAARLAVYREHDLLAHDIISRTERHLTDQEHADMKASFAGGAQ